MKTKIKIIIAREGLIIISLLIISGGSFLISSFLVGEKTRYKSNAQEIEPVVKKDLSSYSTPELERIVNKKEESSNDEWVDVPLNSNDGPWEDYKPNSGENIDFQPIAISSGIILRFPKGTDYKIIEKTLQRDFPKLPGKDWIVLDGITEDAKIAASYDERGNRKFNNFIYKDKFFINISIFFLFIAYPIYWIFKFIVWAVLMLKANKAEQRQ